MMGYTFHSSFFFAIAPYAGFLAPFGFLLNEGRVPLFLVYLISLLFAFVVPTSRRLFIRAFRFKRHVAGRLVASHHQPRHHRLGSIAVGRHLHPVGSCVLRRLHHRRRPHGPLGPAIAGAR